MDLEQLRRNVRGETVLDRITSAMDVKRELDELTEALIDGVVRDAREAGHSWSEIGAAMGVTKQAAQQRSNRKAVA
jgi:hypothetical protein